MAIPWVVAIDAAGHTPGHVVFRLANTLFAGDILHSELFQFTHPEIYPVFDNDKDAALVMRKKILNLAAENGWYFVSSHVSNKGFIKKDGDGFKLVVEK